MTWEQHSKEKTPTARYPDLLGCRYGVVGGLSVVGDAARELPILEIADRLPTTARSYKNSG